MTPVDPLSTPQPVMGVRHSEVVIATGDKDVCHDITRLEVRTGPRGAAAPRRLRAAAGVSER